MGLRTKVDPISHLRLEGRVVVVFGEQIPALAVIGHHIKEVVGEMRAFEEVLQGKGRLVLLEHVHQETYHVSEVVVFILDGLDSLLVYEEKLLYFEGTF